MITMEPAGKTTYFPFPGYAEEVNGSTVTRRVTYTIAGTAVASRVQVVGGSNTLYYLYTDHLGSTVAQSNTTGTITLTPGSRTYYLPYGSYRGTPPTQTLTDRDFTGQRENRELGLLYFNARFYVPSIGRFASADTVVPDPANPQQFNRYTYSLNSPLNFTDPSGHIACEVLGTENCDSNGKYVNSGSSTPIPPPSQMAPPYVPSRKFTTWPIDPDSPGYSTQLQGFGDTRFAWEGRDSYYKQTGRLHSAVDIFVDKGTAVSSVGEGRVVCVGCGIANPVEGVTDSGIAIYHGLCRCVMYYTHLSSYSVKEKDIVEAGTLVGLSGTGFGSEHLHLEIRPYEGAAEFWNPLYFFDPALLTDLSYQDYHNPFPNPEWRIIGYTSKGDDGVFYSYWNDSLPQIDCLQGC